MAELLRGGRRRYIDEGKVLCFVGVEEGEVLLRLEARRLVVEGFF